MPEQPPHEFVLGIDLGSNSLGWALVGLIDGEPAELLRAGARVFEAGMEGDLASGREESRNLKRREARSHRRLLWRRRRRLTKLFNLLQRSGLLPPTSEILSIASGNGHRLPPLPERLQDYFNNLDKDLLSSAWFQAKASSGLFPAPEHTMPYILRASALDEPLEPYILGRAIYHLAQRRGFLSNRKQVAKKNDDEGAVKEGIAELRKAMQEKQARTLGEHLAHLSPALEQIRCRWTARDMYEKEFHAIWDAQAGHHPGLLTRERKKQIYNAIFYQRPLWFDRSTIGQCELEPGQRRAPRSSFVAQRFRLLQAVNNLRLELADGSERALTPQERDKLVQELEIKGDLTFARVRKLLKLSREARFTIERGGEKVLPGNRTTAKFYEVFGERWLEMSAAEHDQALQDVLGIQKEVVLRRRAAEHWKLDDESAKKFAHISPEPDYFNLSRKAIDKLLPLLETGTTYAEARKELYPESFKSGEPEDLLPPVERSLAEIRNPAVMRSLTELRKVVNAVIRQHGKPRKIHVELARDLKKSKKQRQTISDNNRRNEKSRAEAAKKIAAEAGLNDPKPMDIRRVQLAEECHWMCPYTGRSISMRSLLGPEPQFDIEHIIPFSRSMDNSFQNLTLCYVPENRSVKGNKTPWQAYHGNPEKYEAILGRVRKLSGDRQMVAAKLRRFGMDDEELEDFLETFRNRQLNDTAYATSIAAGYLGSLYGGLIDSGGNRRIQVVSGQATAHFRRLWKLNSILNDGPRRNGGATPKSRDDHRHHSVDAVVVGLTNAAMIKRLSDAAERAPSQHRRRFASLEGPWPNFTDSVRAEVDRIVVSHRVSKKVSGGLHKDTNYSLQEFGENKRRHRVKLTELGEKDIMSDDVIPDSGVRKLVRDKLLALGGGKPEKLFATPANLPCFVTADGRRILVKKVRIEETIKTRKVGRGPRTRYVKPGGNHHLEIFGLPGTEGGDKKWEALGVVTMLDAYKRLIKREPIVQKNSKPGWEFRFSLAQGETLAFDDGRFKGQYFVVRTISEEEKRGSVKIEMVPINDARRKDAIKRAKLWVTKSPNELRKWGARKVVVSSLGEVREAHD